MTSDWLAGLKALEAAATKGPWRYSTCYGVATIESASGDIAHAVDYLNVGDKHDNATLIATSRNIFPELIAVINEARLLDQCALGSWECNCQNCRTLRAIDALAGKVVVK